MSTTAPPPAGQTGAGAPPPSVIEGGATVFVPPFNPMITSKTVEASASPEVLAWLRAAWGEWDARPQVAVALVYRACQAAGFIPQPDDTFKGFMAWIPSGVADAAQTRVITAAATPARQPASQQATGDFPARLPGGEEVEDVEDVEEAEAVTKALLESAKKTAKRNKKRIKRARQRALLIGVIAALTGIAGVIAGATGGWVAFAAAALALITGVAGLITGIKTYGGHSRRPRR
jgi:hypothetical protein